MMKIQPDRIFQLGLYQHVRHRYMVGVKRFIHICLVNKLIADPYFSRVYRQSLVFHQTEE